MENDYKRALRSDLATVDRRIRIYNVELEECTQIVDEDCLFPFPIQLPVGSSTCAVTPRQSECRSFYTARARLECWVLPQRKTLLIRAELPDSFPVIEVEAEVSVRDLADSKGLDVDVLLTDPELGEIAQELIWEAELLVLNNETLAPPTVNGNGQTNSLRPHKHELVTKLVVHLDRGEGRNKSTAAAFIKAIERINSDHSESVEYEKRHSAGNIDLSHPSSHPASHGPSHHTHPPSMHLTPSNHRSSCDSTDTAPESVRVHLEREMDVTVHYTLPLRTSANKALANRNQAARKSVDYHNTLDIVADSFVNRSTEASRRSMDGAAVKRSTDACRRSMDGGIAMNAALNRPTKEKSSPSRRSVDSSTVASRSTNASPFGSPLSNLIQNALLQSPNGSRGEFTFKEHSTKESSRNNSPPASPGGHGRKNSSEKGGKTIRFPSFLKGNTTPLARGNSGKWEKPPSEGIPAVVSVVGSTALGSERVRADRERV